jgi:hypothetical protein
VVGVADVTTAGVPSIVTLTFAGKSVPTSVKFCVLRSAVALTMVAW